MHGSPPYTGTKDKIYETIWCIKDAGKPEYLRLKHLSETTYPDSISIEYGHYYVYFCAVVIAVFIAKKWLYVWHDRNKKKSDSVSIFTTLYYKISAINRYVSYRRIPKFFCEVFQLPSSLGNLIIVFIGTVYMFCYAFIPKPWFKGCRGLGSPPLALRTGLQSTALIPFIFILSGKVNIISQVTDISYEKVNVYHRWLSIISCMMGWVHTIPIYVQSFQEGGHERIAFLQRTSKYFYNGVPPLLFMNILTIFSHSALRAKYYELWLYLHWICALGLYVSLFIHTHNLLQSWKYLAATIVFWMVQLVWRAVSKGMFKPNTYGLTNKCKMRRFASNNENDHYFEILIENSDMIRWEPGQHIFLKIPGVRVLESHPFSVISNYEASNESHIKLIIKTGGLHGLTRYLYDKLPDTEYTKFDVMVDGPYGGSQRKHNKFDSVYLLASGTGISAVLPFLYESCEKLNSRDSITRSIQFDWIIKTVDNVEWIFPELQKILKRYDSLINSGIININIHISESIELGNTSILDMLQTYTSSGSESIGSITKSECCFNEKNSLVNIINVKPNVKDIVENYRSTLLEKNIIILSGSDSMKIQASNCIAGLQTEVFNKDKNVNEIYLHSESFGW